MESEPKPRYHWKKTRPDSENDFVGMDEGEEFARMYLHHMNKWVWFFNHDGYPGFSGSAETARLAAKDAEDYWDGVKGKSKGTVT